MTLHLVKPAPGSNVESERTDPLDDLYTRYASDVKRWVRRLAGPSADVEDLLHDVFVVALRRHFTFRGDADIKTWLFRITHHVVRGRRRRGLVRALLFGRHRDAIAEATLPSATPHEEVERHERHLRLYRALDGLPDAYRTALILYEIEGLPGEQVAELTGISLGTLWVRLHRGRAKLLACLSAEEQP
ncbi:MAG TPA: RNA polymerase sigma factor [Polyangia bacterium]